MSSKLKIKLHENNGSYTHNVFKIFSVSVDVHQAYPDKDESPKVLNGRNFNELVDEQYDSLSQALNAVDSTHIFAQPDWKATEYRFGILRLEAVVLVGKRNEPAYGDDVEAWKRGEKTLWNAHYKVGIRCEQSTTLPDAELTSELDDMAIEHSF